MGMQLTDIRPCLMKMEISEQESFLRGYFLRREKQLSSVVVKTKKKSKSTGARASSVAVSKDKISLTHEQFEVLRKLGIC